MKSLRSMIVSTVHTAHARFLLPAFLLWIGVAISSVAQTPHWPVILGGSANDSVTAIAPTPDGGYVIAGATASSDGDVSGYHGGSHDAWLIKLDSDGTVIWKKTIGGTGDDQATALTPSPDGGFVVTGISTSRDGDMGDLDRNWPAGFTYLWVFKLNHDGEIVWKQAKGMSKGLFPSAITAAPGGGYTIAGYYFFSITKSSGNFFYVLNLAETGSILWDTYFGGRNGDDRLYGITATSDGGYVVAGKSSSPVLDAGIQPGAFDFKTNHNAYTSYDAVVARLDNEGKLVWYTFLGGSELDYANAITATPDGGFLMAGYTASNDGNVVGNHGGGDAWLVKLTGDGALSWQKTVGGSGTENAYAIKTTANGGYALAGVSSSKSNPASTQDAMWLARLNSTGDLVSQNVYGNAGRHEGRALAVSPAGFYIVAGTTHPLNNELTVPRGNGDFLVARFDENLPLTLHEPTIFCTTGRILLSISGGDGSLIRYSVPGVMRFSPESVDGYIEPELLNNPRPILITATQNEQTVSYFFDFPGYYTRNCDHNPPRFRPLALYPPTYNCQTGAITFNTTGGTGSPITYLAPGITRSSLTSNTGVVEQELRNDPKPILITAIQDGVTIGYTFDFKALCSGQTPLTLLAPSYQCATGAIHVNTTGGDGSPIEFAAPGITGWTTNPDQYVDVESRTANDVQPFTLMARQSGVTVYYSWDLKMACGRARVAADERTATLQVTVLGNPVYAQSVNVDIFGVADQAVAVTITDLQGRPVHQQTINRSAPTERLSLPLHSSRGVLLLTVSTADQRRQIKLVRP